MGSTSVRNVLAFSLAILLLKNNFKWVFGEQLELNDTISENDVESDYELLYYDDESSSSPSGESRQRRPLIGIRNRNRLRGKKKMNFIGKYLRLTLELKCDFL